MTGILANRFRMGCPWLQRIAVDEVVSYCVAESKVDSMVEQVHTIYSPSVEFVDRFYN